MTIDSFLEPPLIAITVGDMAGIGPEVAIKAAISTEVKSLAVPILIGPKSAISRSLAELGQSPHIVEVPELTRSAIFANHPRDNMVLVHTPQGSSDVSEVAVGVVDGRAGRAAAEYLHAAIDACLAGECDAIATAPLSKASLSAGGIAAPGHTEILAERTGSREFAMMLYLPSSDVVPSPYGLGVAHVTLHTALANVFSQLTMQKVEEAIGLVGEFLRRLGLKEPRIGVAALNPHAGEDGLFGSEEGRIIAPAVASARRAWNVEGPIPADALFRRAFNGAFDGLVAMYHDQGHIAFKLMGFESAVNVTLGLPIIRTSPSHGTAFDIAGKGIANPAGMIAAVRLAALLTRRHATNAKAAPG